MPQYEHQPDPSGRNRVLLIVTVILLLLDAVVLFMVFRKTQTDANAGQADSTVTVVDTVAGPSAAEIEAAERQKEQEEKERRERFISFRTPDLSAFMLHGHVKSMYDSGGNGYTYQFSKEGKLTSAVSSFKNAKGKIRHEGGFLYINFENPSDPMGYWGFRYKTDGSGRLTEVIVGAEDYEDRCVYSNYDAHGWPTRCTIIEEYYDQQTTSSISYSNIDEYGNWRHSTEGKGTNRTITYYPLEDFE